MIILVLLALGIEKMSPPGSFQAKRGTPCYMAPELFSDDATHSTASDLWALGCVLYECAMGRAPFMNASLTQLMQDILSKEPQPIPGRT
jgi:serine/threonine-protein kinase ULK4